MASVIMDFWPRKQTSLGRETKWGEEGGGEKERERPHANQIALSTGGRGRISDSRKGSLRAGGLFLCLYLSSLSTLSLSPGLFVRVARNPR